VISARSPWRDPSGLAQRTSLRSLTPVPQKQGAGHRILRNFELSKGSCGPKLGVVEFLRRAWTAITNSRLESAEPTQWSGMHIARFSRRSALSRTGSDGVMEHEGLETHLWSGNQPRELEIEGKPVVLFRCPVCERNFAREHGESNWRAAHVGTFRITYLSDPLSRQWVSEPCPGKPPTPAPESIGDARPDAVIPRPAPGRHRVNRKAKTR
jgi:hypothetical protein